MNFIKFPVISTNIFPLANTTTGTQLLTEYNMRSRELVTSDPQIEYDSWQSYTHDLYDFEISAFADEAGAITPYVLNISRGQGIINGHYIESLIDVQIDLVEANAELAQRDQAQLTGRLAVGLRAYYATQSTMAGSMKAEDDDMYYQGVQVVILPKSELRLPKDVPTDETQVNCHLLLGDFLYQNGVISDVNQNKDKIKYISGDRLSSLDGLISDQFITKTGMDPQKFYVFGGYGASKDRDTWCDATDSLINWTDAITLQETPDAMVGTTAKFDTIVDPEVSYNYTIQSGGTGYKINDIVATNISGVFVRVTIVNEDTGAIVGVTASNAGGPNSSDGTGAVILAVQSSAKSYNTKVALYLPHKQLDDYKDEHGNTMYYPTKTLPLPLADYATNSAGTVDATYTKNIKAIAEKIADVYHLTGGKQLMYIEHLSVGDPLPTINAQAWKIGDYILVGQDDNVATSTGSRAPSTIYAIVPGYVKSYQYVGRGQVDGIQPHYNEHHVQDGWETSPDYENDIPEGLNGVALEEVQVNYSGQPLRITEDTGDEWHYIPSEIVEPSDTVWTSDNPDGPIQGTSDFRGATAGRDAVGESYGPDYFINTVKYNINITTSRKFTYSISTPGSNYQVGDKVKVYGYDDQYVTVKRVYTDGSTTGCIGEVIEWDGQEQSPHGSGAKITATKVQYSESHSFREYYKVYSNSKKFTWSDAVIVSNEFGLAQTTTIGGFLNVDDTVTDGGYVTRDDNGHLRLIDYTLLRSGTLAYQLGEDVNFPSNMELDELQSYLDEYVNDRVAFPNATQLQSDRPNVININIPLVEYNADIANISERTPIIIRDIDSRFNTSVHITFTGSGITSNTLIYILDCEKVRITVDTNNDCYPEIQVFRSGLYYDPALFNYIKTYKADSTSPGMQNITLWYEQFESTDPNLTVNDMTVSDLTASIQPSEYTKWNADLAPNDNHYYVALRSITFSGYGEIIGCEVIMADGSDKIYSGKHVIVKDFVLPQGSGLQYPEKCLMYELKIVGSFTSGYYDAISNIWMISVVNFSASVDNYSQTSSNLGAGTIAFIADTQAIDAGLDDSYKEGGVKPWTFGSYNVFKGGYVIG